MAYLERIFEMMDEKPTIISEDNAKELPFIKGKVDFENVVFGYESNGKNLDQVNIKVNPGETIALVGPTGSGKTTIVSLISRFYDVNSGEIKIDDINIKSVSLNSLRKQMGIMLQDPFIFLGP